MATKVNYEEYEVKQAEVSDFVRSRTLNFHGFENLWCVERRDDFGAYKYVYASSQRAAVDEACKSKRGWR